MVAFEAAEIRALVEQLAGEIGLPADLDITHRDRRDHPARLGQAHPRSTPSCCRSRAGALEDAKAAPLSSTPAAPPTSSVGSCSRSRDRRDPAFADAPSDDELAPPAVVGLAGLLRGSAQPARPPRAAAAPAVPLPQPPRLHRCGRRRVRRAVGRRQDLTWADIAALSDKARRRPLVEVVGGDRVEQVDLGRVRRGGPRSPGPSRPCPRSRSGPAGAPGTPASAPPRTGPASSSTAPGRCSGTPSWPPAEHDVAGQHRLEPTRVEGVERHGDHRAARPRQLPLELAPPCRYSAPEQGVRALSGQLGRPRWGRLTRSVS